MLGLVGTLQLLLLLLVRIALVLLVLLVFVGLLLLLLHGVLVRLARRYIADSLDVLSLRASSSLSLLQNGGFDCLAKYTLVLYRVEECTNSLRRILLGGILFVGSRRGSSLVLGNGLLTTVRRS